MPRKGKKRERQICLVKCFCATFKVSAFLCAACIIVVVVMSWMYSIAQLVRSSNSNAETQILWVLHRAYHLEVYKCASRAQQSFERHCTAAMNNFKAFKPPGDKRAGRAKGPTPVTPGAGTARSNLTTDMGFEDPGDKQATMGTVRPAAAAESDPLGGGPALARPRRRFKPGSTMEYTCVLNAEAARTRIFRYSVPPLEYLKQDLPHRVVIFYFYADILNAVVCPIFFILSLILIWGIATENPWMILAWLATFLFYIIFAVVYFYFRLIFVVVIYFYFSSLGYLIGIFCLLLLSLVMAFKYYIILTYFWALCPTKRQATDFSNVHLVVTSREVKRKRQK